MNREAAKAPVGSNHLLFNPSLAGGTSQDESVHIRGAYIGLDLKHGQPELIRAAMEGVALNLRLRLDLLRKYTRLEDEILFVGGGAKSRFYLGIFADVFNTRILKTDYRPGRRGAGRGGHRGGRLPGCGRISAASMRSTRWSSGWSRTRRTTANTSGCCRCSSWRADI